MKKLRKKAILTEILMQVIILAFLLVAVGAYTYHQSQDTNYIRLYVVRDLPIFMKAVSASHGQISTTYSMPFKYNIYGKSEALKFSFVFKETFLEASGKRYPYSKNLFLKNNLNDIYNSSQLKILNHDYVFEVHDYEFKTPPLYSFETKYSNVNTKDINWQIKPIVINPKTHPSASLFITNHHNLNLKNDLVNNTALYLEFLYINSSDIIMQIPYDLSGKSRKFASILLNNILSYQSETKKINNAYIQVIDWQINSQSAVKINIGTKTSIPLSRLDELLISSMEEYFK